MPDTVRQAPISEDGHRCESAAGSSSCCSSPAVSPSHSFKRSRSTFYLLDRRTSPPPGRQMLQPPQNATVNWYATFFWRLINSFVGLRWMANVLLVRVPALWLCLWARVAWSCVRIPLVVSRRALRSCFGRRYRHGGGGGGGGCGHRAERPARTVLINGGSTVQALHLARNFYATGARVVVCEIEGRAELSSFSIAVDAHYTVPGPTEDSCVQYVDALRAIVEKERVGFYVATGTTVSPYHDAVAKSHLELLGCKCHAPGLDAVSALDDLFEVFQRCEAVGLPVPKYLLVQSKEDIIKLYDNVLFRVDRHFIVNVGASGCKARHVRLQLPANRKSLTLPGPVSADCPWLLVRNCLGSYYTTCTTIHRGRVIGNVTSCGPSTEVRHMWHGGCSDSVADVVCTSRNQLIDDWVTQFVSALPAPLDGTVQFTLCVTPSRNVVPMGCRVGVPVAYASYRSNFEQILYPACEHVEPAEPEVTEIVARYYVTQLVSDTLGQMLVATDFCSAVKRLVYTVATCREMVFACWDPLPYFVYYNLQMITDYINNEVLGGDNRATHKNKYTTF